MAYEWCSVVCENYYGLAGAKDLLLFSLEIGFRHLDPKNQEIKAELTHPDSDSYLQMVKIFDGGDNEMIADLLHAWTSKSTSHQPFTSLQICAPQLVGLRYKQYFSKRLRQLIIRAVELIDFKKFNNQAGDFIELLGKLSVSVEDTGERIRWAKLILHTIRSTKGIQHLPHSYWELLPVLIASEPWQQEDSIDYPQNITKSLEHDKQWEKLECWIGVVWMLWPPGVSGQTEEALRHITLLLFKQQPNAIQKLKGWMEQWRTKWWCKVPETFQQICDEANPNVVPL